MVAVDPQTMAAMSETTANFRNMLTTYQVNTNVVQKFVATPNAHKSIGLPCSMAAYAFHKHMPANFVARRL